jgi:hypothetical protein
MRFGNVADRGLATKADVDRVRLQKVLMDELYAKQRYLLESIFQAAGWNDGPTDRA